MNLAQARRTEVFVRSGVEIRSYHAARDCAAAYGRFLVERWLLAELYSRAPQAVACRCVTDQYFARS